MSSKTSTNYTEVEDYDCSACDWSLHVEKGMWEKFPNQHQEILDYIHQSIDTHIKESHGVKNTKHMYPIDKDINTYKQTPYVYHTDTENSSLITLE